MVEPGATVGLDQPVDEKPLPSEPGGSPGLNIAEKNIAQSLIPNSEIQPIAVRGGVGKTPEAAAGLANKSAREDDRTDVIDVRKISGNQRHFFEILMGDDGFLSAIQNQNAEQAAFAAALVVEDWSNTYSEHQVRKPAPLKHHSVGGQGYNIDAQFSALQREMLELEEVIPWNCVRKIWKNKRATWRRQVKQMSHIPGLASKIKELKSAILMDDNLLLGCGPEWSSKLDVCLQGMGSSLQLTAIWDEMKTSVQTWMYSASRMSNIGEIDSIPTTIAVNAMKNALQSCGAQRSSLLQVPIESMIGSHSGRLLGIREAVEIERQKILMKRQKKNFDTTDDKLDDGFDSGIETDKEDATDVDSTYDVFV
jgi:hypothetical protein